MDKCTENLLKLINENPELPVIPMVDYEVVGDDSCCRWGGSLGTAEIKEYVGYEMYRDFEETVYKEDSDRIMEYLTDHDENLTDADIVKIVEGLEWKKAIFLNIDLPD